ncbi:MAG: hypothetical protein P8Z80_05695, partial [Pseudolabrys sp.]
APSFVSRALNTPSSDLWKPTVAQLYSGHAITGVTDGTQFALSGLGNSTKKQIGEMLSKAIPALGAMSRRYPNSYQSIIRIFYDQYLAGETRAEAFAATRKKFVGVMSRLKPIADDATLHSMAQWYADAYKSLAIRSPATCYTFASGRTGYGHWLPPDLVKRDAELSVRVVETAAVRHKTDNSALAATFKKLALLLKVYNLSGAEIGLISRTDVIRPDKYLEYCRASAIFFRAIAALSARDAATVMRKVLSTGDTAGGTPVH